jgi:hypothetical protein
VEVAEMNQLARRAHQEVRDWTAFKARRKAGL